LFRKIVVTCPSKLNLANVFAIKGDDPCAFWTPDACKLGLLIPTDPLALGPCERFDHFDVTTASEGVIV
jgi:hypothetical protein